MGQPRLSRPLPSNHVPPSLHSLHLDSVWDLEVLDASFVTIRLSLNVDRLAWSHVAI